MSISLYLKFALYIHKCVYLYISIYMFAIKPIETQGFEGAAAFGPLDELKHVALERLGLCRVLGLYKPSQRPTLSIYLNPRGGLIVIGFSKPR